VTGWDVLTGRASVPAGMLAELAALRAALPGYGVILTSHSPARRSGAIRRDPGPRDLPPYQHRPRRPVAGSGRPRPARRQPGGPLAAFRPNGHRLLSRWSYPPIDCAKARPTGK
jgi:hypothetical protein